MKSGDILSGKVIFASLVVLLVVGIAVLVLAASVDSVNLISPANNSWTNQTYGIPLVFNYTGNSTNASCTYTIGIYSGTNTSVLNNTNTTFTVPSSEVNLTDGSYLWNVSCTNGTVSKVSANWTLNIDTIIPYVNLTSPEDYPTYNTTQLQLNYTVNDTNLNETWYYYNGTNKTINESIPFTALEGSSTLTLYANDSAGNVNSTSVTFSVDTIAPNVTLPTYINGTFYNDSGNLSINISVNDSDLGEGVSCIINVNGTNQSYDLSPDGWCNAFDVFLTNLSDGNHTINVWADDSAGNVGQNSSYILRTDSTNPLVSYSNGTEEDNVNISQSNVYVNVSVVEPNEANITFSIYNSTGSVNSTTYTDKTREINWANLSDGTYSYNVSVVDLAGNVNHTSTRNITLDTIAPNVTLISPEDLTSSTKNNYNFTFNVSDNGEITNCSLIFNGHIVDTDTNINKGLGGIYRSSLGVGTIKWSVNCTDYVGNVGNSSTRTLIVKSLPGSSTVVSGSGYPTFFATDSELSEGYQKVLYKNWKVKFKFNSDYHILKVENITNSVAVVGLGSNQNGTTISVGQEKMFNLNGDSYYDISVILNSIDTSSKIYPKANFTIQTIHKAMTVKKDNNEKVVTPKPKVAPKAVAPKPNLDWVWVTILVIIVLIFSGAGYKKFKK